MLVRPMYDVNALCFDPHIGGDSVALMCRTASPRTIPATEMPKVPSAAAVSTVTAAEPRLQARTVQRALPSPRI